MSTIYNFQHQPIVSSASDTFITIMDGTSISTMDDFYKAISKALNFPDYFGENLDALDEMLYEMDWIEHDFILLMIQHSEDMLKQEPEKRAQILNLIQEIDNPYFEVVML